MTGHEQFAEDIALYAVDALDGDARERVEAHLSVCAECRRELRALRGATAMMLMTAPPQNPPGAARNKFLSALGEGTKVKKGWNPWLVHAFAVLVLAMVSAALWRQNVRLHKQLEVARNELQQEQAQNPRAAELANVLSDPGSVRVTLAAAGAKPQPQIETILQRKSGRLVLISSNLPAVPSQRAYQLWLLPEQGAPIPSGTFAPRADGRVIAQMPGVAEATRIKGLAITLEPAGGSPAPTSPILFVGS